MTKASIQTKVIFPCIALLVIGSVYSACTKQQDRSSNQAKRDTLPPQATALKQKKTSFPDYTLLSQTQLVEHRNNDGDSFFIKHADGEHIFRLYFVDAPESQFKRYRDGKTNGKRLYHQGNYFGKSTQEDTVRIGQEAKKFTLHLLKTRPFVVYTQWEEVYTSGRFYAFIFFPQENQFLCELLVTEGLARIYTKGNPTPTGKSTEAFTKELRKLEAIAKKHHKGGWSE